MKIILNYCAVSAVVFALAAPAMFFAASGAVDGNEVKSEAPQKAAKEKKGACCEEKAAAAAEVKTVNSQYLDLPDIPNITMFNQDGKRARVYDILKGKITVINFIYTSCTSVCQILTSNFRQLEKALDVIDKDSEVQLVSISIDPDTDTPARLRQYAEKQRIDLSRWTLLVSSLNSIEKLSRSLGFSNLDKSTHAPGVVIWDDIDKKWQRFVGITPAHILSKEIAKLPAVKE